MQQAPLDMPGHFDSVNTAFWDSVAGCYRSFTRYYADFPENATPLCLAACGLQGGGGNNQAASLVRDAAASQLLHIGRGLCGD